MDNDEIEIIEEMDNESEDDLVKLVPLLQKTTKPEAPKSLKQEYPVTKGERADPRNALKLEDPEGQRSSGTKGAVGPKELEDP
jgi:hypothetical protein